WIFKLRYKIYVEEMGRFQKHADHQQKILREPYDDSGVLLGVYSDTAAIATIRYNWLSDPAMRDYVDLYGLTCVPNADRARSVIVTKLMCDRRYRNTGVLKDILLAVFEDGLRAGAAFAYMDTNLPLVPLFEKFGWEWRDKAVVDHPEYGEVALMQLSMLNYSLLESRSSPFCSILNTYNGTDRFSSVPPVFQEKTMNQF
ncbi:MAG: hypothetical protein KGS45_14235, partial [Planctomycetes bacterium]|nr:hypothetical protein [Planctomycetota bacterium]